MRACAVARIGFDRRRVQPGAVRLVGVRLEQPGAARAERAVDLILDRAHGQPVVAVSNDLAASSRGPARRRRPCAPSSTAGRASGPRRSSRLMRVDDLERRPGVLKAGDALRHHFLIRQFEHAPGPRFGLLGRRRGSPAPRRTSAATPSRAGARSDCRCASFRISPPVGFAVARSIVRQLHRFRVGERRVAAGVRQDDGVVRRDLVERLVRRKALDVRLRRTDVHFSWCQPRPMIHCPGLALSTASRDHLHDLVPALRAMRSRFSLFSPMPGSARAPR